MGTTIGGLAAIAAAVVETDIIEIEDNPGGTPLSAKVTVAELRQHLDNEATVFGTGDDASILFDATNLVFSTAGAYSFTGADVWIANGQGLVVGNAAQIVAGEVTSEAQVLGTAVADGSVVIYLGSTTDSLAPALKLVKSANNTIGTFSTAVVNNEVLGHIQVYGTDGTDADTLAAQIGFFVDDAGVGTGTIGGEIILSTATIAGTLTSALTISASQNVTIAGTLTVSGSRITVGTTPATEGVISIPNNVGVFARNNANGDNVWVIGVDSSDVINIDNDGGGAAFGGLIRVSNATGPIIVNEASSATNPTLIPDRTELGTGIGGTSNELSLIALDSRMVQIDGRVSGTGSFDAIILRGPNISQGSSASNLYRLLHIDDRTITYTSQTQITTLNQGMGLSAGAVTLNQSAGAITVDEASTLHVPAITAGGSVTITLNKMISTGVAGCYLNSLGAWNMVGSVNTGVTNLSTAGSLTIATGAVAITKSYHTLVVQGGAGSGADALVTATGGVEGDLLILKTTTSGANDTVTISDGTGADTFILAGGANFVMDHIDDRLCCIHNGTEWVEISRSSNS